MEDSPISEATTARPRPGGGVMPLASQELSLLDRQPPHDPAVEMALLGSMLIAPDVIGPVLMIVDDADVFFSLQHRLIFSAMREMFEANTGIDGITLSNWLIRKGQYDQAGGYDILEKILNCVPNAGNAETYAGMVRDKSLLRRLISACTSTLKDCYESPESPASVLDRSEGRIFEIAQKKQMGKPVLLCDVLGETMEMLHRNNGVHITGVASGYVELDNLTSGLQKGEMIVVAARPSVGKTALAMNIVEHVGVDLKKPVAVFSLEMSRQQLAQRMLCSRSGVDSHSLRRGMLSRDDHAKIGGAVGALAEGSIYIDDTPGLTLLDLRTKARRLKLQYGIEMVVVDYLQLMEAPREENLQQQISSISRGIKALAREMDCPVICLSQLNRASESENRLPRTSDLRESGSIEQDADVVILLHREAVMHRGDKEWEEQNPDKLNEALLIIAKQRNGPCDTVKLTFLGANTRFVTYNPGVM